MGAKAAVLLALVARGAAWRSEGLLPTDLRFRDYIGKFCFDYVPPSAEPNAPHDATVAGTYEVVVRGRTQADAGSRGMQGRLHLMVFSDEPLHWQRARARWHELSCDELRSMSSWFADVSSRLLAPEYKMQLSVRVRQHVRPRFWYFAFVNCGANITEPVKYWLHAKNIHQGFQAEFGMDMRGCMLLEVSFGLLFAGITYGTWAVTRSRAMRLETARPRPLLLLLRISALCSTVGCSCRAVNHAAFAIDGRGLIFAGVLGTLGACAAKALLVVLQFLLARGWALLLLPDQQHHRCTLLTTLLGILSLSVGCEIHELYFHDKSTSFYLYESWTGFLILLLNLGLMIVAWGMMWDTYRREAVPEVRSFYRLVAAACGIYFASLPVIHLFAFTLDPWVVRKYVERAEMGARFMATALLLLCLRPSRLDALVAKRLKNRNQQELLADGELVAEEMEELEEVVPCSDSLVVAACRMSKVATADVPTLDAAEDAAAVL